MSATLKIASVASGLTLFGYSAMHTLRQPAQDFSKDALALDHTLNQQKALLPKPKL